MCFLTWTLATVASTQCCAYVLDMVKPRHSNEEIARLGNALFEREVAPHVSDGDAGRFVAIDIESGSYEIDRHELSAVHRLLARKPGAQIYLRRVDVPYTHRFGTRLNPRANPAA